jgi:hypothetical protein
VKIGCLADFKLQVSIAIKISKLSHRPQNRKDWAQKVENVHKTADFRSVYFNDCTVQSGLITFEPLSNLDYLL